MVSKKNEIKYVIISHNFAGYNGDNEYEIDIKNMDYIEYARKEEERIADRDRCMGTESFFVYNGKRISESEVKEILNKRNLWFL